MECFWCFGGPLPGHAVIHSSGLNMDLAFEGVLAVLSGSSVSICACGCMVHMNLSITVEDKFLASGQSQSLCHARCYIPGTVTYYYVSLACLWYTKLVQTKQCFTDMRCRVSAPDCGVRRQPTVQHSLHSSFPFSLSRFSVAAERSLRLRLVAAFSILCISLSMLRASDNLCRWCLNEPKFKIKLFDVYRRVAWNLIYYLSRVSDMFL